MKRKLIKVYFIYFSTSSGSVCLDVINQAWSPMFDLINIFETFLPQLLLYPNPADPLNPEAAAMMLKEPKKYELKVKEHVRKYAAIEMDGNERKKLEKEFEEDTEMEIEDEEDDGMSFSEVSELSETSDIALIE